MNSIITLPKLVDLLSRATSTDQHEAEKFVLNFTNLVAEALLTDSSVKIKGFGTFTRVESFGKTVVKFEPEKEISERINAPFSCFEPETLADGVSADILAEADKKGPKPQPTLQPQQQPTPHPTPQPKQEPAPQPESQPQQEPAPNPTPQPKQEPAPQPSPQPQEQQARPEYPLAEGHNRPTAEERVIEPTPKVDSPSAIAPLEEVRPATERIERRTMPMDAHSEEEGQPRRPVPPRISYSHDYDDDRSSSKNSWFWLSIAFILGILIGFGVGYFCHDPIAARVYFGTKSRLGSDDIVEAEMWYEPEDTISLVKEMVDFNNVDSLGIPNAEYVTDPTTTPSDPLIQPETSEAKPVEKETPQAPASQTPAQQTPTQQTPAQQTPATQAEGTPVYDMIPAGGTLQTLAAKHYGNKVYWVYIYEENKSNISNPNYVSQNLKLRIPPRSKYDVSSVEAENQAAAKKKGIEVLSKF